MALADEHVLMWWITLGLGVVVASAVILLLFLLLQYVKDVDKGVQEVWDMAGRVAAQTVTTWMLPQSRPVRRPPRRARAPRQAPHTSVEGRLT